MALDNDWRRLDLRQSNVRRQREAAREFVQCYLCDLVLFCLFPVIFVCVLPAIYTIGESGMGPNPVLFVGSEPLAMLLPVSVYLII